VRGAAAVAGMYSGRARGAQPALVGGVPGLAWVVNGRTRVAFDFTVAGGKVVEITLVADPDTLAELGVTVGS
jgi:hypothetical protein